MQTAQDVPRGSSAVSGERGWSWAIAPLYMHSINVRQAVVAATVAALQAGADVVRVERDHSRDTATLPNDPSYADQWALPRIGWDSAYGSVTPSGSATVALLDTGVDASHPDLADLVVPGTNILTGSGDGESDANGHGTEVAGIVAAATGNGVGIAGVGYARVKVMPVTVLSEQGLGLDSDVRQNINSSQVLFGGLDDLVTERLYDVHDQLAEGLCDPGRPADPRVRPVADRRRQHMARLHTSVIGNLMDRHVGKHHRQQRSRARQGLGDGAPRLRPQGTTQPTTFGTPPILYFPFQSTITVNNVVPTSSSSTSLLARGKKVTVIYGRAIDSSGNPMPNVWIRITQGANQAYAQTDAGGNYVFYDSQLCTYGSIQFATSRRPAGRSQRGTAR